MDYFIITGTSRGIGQAIAEQLISSEHYLFCISRERNHSLTNKSKNITYLEFDLHDIDQIEALMNRIFSEIDLSKSTGVYLINNASMIAPVAFIDSAAVNEITGNIHVNLLAPILLTSTFMKHTKTFLGKKRILNISSSSAKHHHPGMSLYSASKAGLDVFTQCVGLEQSHTQTPVGIISIWPGMIDTNLQKEARTQDQAAFPSAQLFGKAKDAGMLTTPEETAQQIIAFLFTEHFEHGAIVDIYDYSKLQQHVDTPNKNT